jgi:elongation factor P--(R)-beta-lysine ligase
MNRLSSWSGLKETSFAMPQSHTRSAASPLWSPEVHAGRRPFLIGRTRVLAGWRSWFEAAGFTEVETSILQASPGNEAHIAAFATVHVWPSGEKRQLYLHTSPEFACKKLLAAGETKIFTLARVFRNGEIGPLHQPEFTMLEWYRAAEAYDVLIADCQKLVQAATQAMQSDRLRWRGLSCDPVAPMQRLTVSDAFRQFAAIDLESTLAGPSQDRGALAGQARAAGLRITDDDSWSDIFSKVIAEKIEPNLGHGALTVLDRYPASEAALARLCADDARYAERFELYACGVELANAFGELTDAAEQRCRFEHEMRERNRIYNDPYPLDEDFLAALEIMPEACGIALGVERLIALACGAPDISHVMWTPVAGQVSPG